MRADGGVEILAPALIEAAGPGMIVFVASAKYSSALQSNVSAAITTAELGAGAKCATLISANPYADFARVLKIFFPPYRSALGIATATLAQRSGAPAPLHACFDPYWWQRHCNGLFQPPAAA